MFWREFSPICRMNDVTRAPQKNYSGAPEHLNPALVRACTKSEITTIQINCSELILTASATHVIICQKPHGTEIRGERFKLKRRLLTDKRSQSGLDFSRSLFLQIPLLSLSRGVRVGSSFLYCSRFSPRLVIWPKILCSDRIRSVILLYYPLLSQPLGL